MIRGKTLTSALAGSAVALSLVSPSASAIWSKEQYPHGPNFDPFFFPAPSGPGSPGSDTQWQRVFPLQWLLHYTDPNGAYAAFVNAHGSEGAPPIEARIAAATGQPNERAYPIDYASLVQNITEYNLAAAVLRGMGEELHKDYVGMMQKLTANHANHTTVESLEAAVNGNNIAQTAHSAKIQAKAQLGKVVDEFNDSLKAASDARDKYGFMAQGLAQGHNPLTDDERQEAVKLSDMVDQQQKYATAHGHPVHRLDNVSTRLTELTKKMENHIIDSNGWHSRANGLEQQFGALLDGEQGRMLAADVRAPYKELRAQLITARDVASRRGLLSSEQRTLLIEGAPTSYVELASLVSAVEIPHRAETAINVNQAILQSQWSVLLDYAKGSNTKTQEVTAALTNYLNGQGYRAAVAVHINHNNSTLNVGLTTKDGDGNRGLLHVPVGALLSSLPLEKQLKLAQHVYGTAPTEANQWVSFPKGTAATVFTKAGYNHSRLAFANTNTSIATSWGNTDRGYLEVNMGGNMIKAPITASFGIMTRG